MPSELNIGPRSSNLFLRETLALGKRQLTQPPSPGLERLRLIRQSSPRPNLRREAGQRPALGFPRTQQRPYRMSR